MRGDMQQLMGKGTVNDPSITTLSKERATRSPSPLPRGVHFNEPEATRSTWPQYFPTQTLRSPVTACFAAVGEKVRMGDVMAGIIVSGQSARFCVMTLYVPNADTTSMTM